MSYHDKHINYHKQKSYIQIGSRQKYKRMYTGEVGNHLCAKCGIVTTNFSSHNRHMLTHTDERPFQCTICDKRFKCHTTLRSHEAVHASTTPYLCDRCGKGFRFLNGLRVHLTLHANPSAFSCTKCTLSCTTKQALTRHLCRVHQIQPMDLASATNFGKSFEKLAETQISEEQKSAPIEIFTCAICNEGFSDIAKLQSHILAHTEEK